MPRPSLCIPGRSESRLAGPAIVWASVLLAWPASTQAQDDDSAWGESETADELGFGSSDGDDANGGTEPGYGEGDDALGFGDNDDALGFGDSDEPLLSDAGELEALAAETMHVPGPLTLTGFLRTREALWVERFDDYPLAKARQSLDLELRYKERIGELLVRMIAAGHIEYDAAYLIERDRFDDAVLDAYEWQFIGGESFVALSYDALELTFGRQIVNWGQGEILSPLDVVNPRDEREPGLAELDDIRIAVLASRLGVFFGQHRIEAMVIHENYFGLLPPPRAEFSTLRPLLEGENNPLADLDLAFEHVPGGRLDPDASRILTRYSYHGHAVDLAFYAASTLDRRGIPLLPTAADLELSETPLRLFHPRYTLLGHAGALPQGAFLFRWELGAELERPIIGQDTQVPITNLQQIRRTQMVGMLGLTYSGIDEGTLSFEWAQSYVADHPERDDDADVALLAPIEQPTFALRYNQSFMRETLQLTAVAMMFGVTAYRGMLARVELSYELRDALNVGLGYVTYQPYGGFGPIYGFDRHDRAFASLRWDFIVF